MNFNESTHYPWLCETLSDLSLLLKVKPVSIDGHFLMISKINSSTKSLKELIKFHERVFGFILNDSSARSHDHRGECISITVEDVHY